MIQTHSARFWLPSFLPLLGLILIVSTPPLLAQTPRTVTTVAGNGTLGFSGDGGAATAAMLAGPEGITLDNAGNIYIANLVNNRVRKVDAVTGIITTFAGNGSAGLGTNTGQATASAMQPIDIEYDGVGGI